MEDGHRTDTTTYVTFITVVSIDLVRICLIIAALKDLDIISADIENDYLIAPCQEKVWIRYGPEFGNLEGKVLVVKMALCGLNSLGAAFRVYLAEMLDDIGFRSRIAYPGVWMKEATKPTGEIYYEYILCYVDDVLCISHDDRQIMVYIQNNVKLKKNKIEEPDFYLGAILKKKEMNIQTMWTMTSQ